MVYNYTQIIQEQVFYYHKDKRRDKLS